MANQIPIKVMKDGSDNTCGLAQFTSSDSVAIAAGGTGLTSQGICAFVQPGLYAVGCQVTYLGICAGKADTGVGYDNTYVGHSAGTAATTACRHTIIGSQAGKAITTCSGTVAIGYNAGTAITFGDRNTAIGTSAGQAITTATDNTLVGYISGCVTTGISNTAFGACTLAVNTVGVDNVAIGMSAGKAQVAAGCNNTFVGSQAGEAVLCRDNTLVGSYAGTAATTGGGNVMIGACVGYGVVGGAYNVYIGDKAGLANTSGNDNVFIGKCAGCADTGSCCLIIGNGTCEIITGNFNTASLGINAPIYSTLTVGVNDTGYDVKFFGASSGAFMLYDESADTLDVRGATAAGPGVLKLTTGELTNVDGGILGRLEFQAPLDSAGSDACLVAASIWGEADATFSATVNTTDLVFATATSATATEKLRLTSTGVLKINNAYCMPSADGSAGYFLCTDGSGALAFAALTSSPWTSSGCFITVPNACFVGVGTATPAAVLHVEGDQIISDGSGLVIGHSAQIAVGNQLGEFQVHGTSDADGETIHAVYAASALGPVHTFAKSRSASIGGFTIAQDGDSLGQIIWYGADGNDFANWGAAIYANVDGTPGNNDMPGRLTFHTTPDGSAGGIERMRIDSAGNVGIGTTAPGKPLTLVQSSTAAFDADSTSGMLLLHNCAADTDQQWVGLVMQVGNGSGDGLARIDTIHNGTAAGADLAFSTRATDASVYEHLRIDTAGRVGINASPVPTAFNTKGVVINQGTADDGIITLKSSDIAHGMTDVAETDTYGWFNKLSALQGGLGIWSITENSLNAAILYAFTDGANSTKAAAGGAAAVIRVGKKSGTGTTSYGADENMAGFYNQASGMQWIIDGSGDVYYAGSTNANHWDDEDDIGLLSAFRNLTTGKKAQHVFGEFIQENAEALHDSGVITLNDDGNHFVSTKGLNALIIDTIRQEGKKWREVIGDYKDKIAQLESRLMRLEA